MAKRVRMGKLASGAYGMRVSAPGVDVDLATNAQLLMSTETVACGQLIYKGSYNGIPPNGQFFPFGMTLPEPPVALYWAECDATAFLPTAMTRPLPLGRGDSAVAMDMQLSTTGVTTVRVETGSITAFFWIVLAERLS